MSRPLHFLITNECSTTSARAGLLSLPHSTVPTPVFMPVGTQGTVKGLLPCQLEELNCEIILGNTYHLGHRPGTDIIERAGGLHKFINWKKSILTDSGGFQMVSLAKLSCVTEEGVLFCSPHNSTEMLLTPEKSIEIQNILGSDIMMQLDDVVPPSTDICRVGEAMERTIRWAQRCSDANKNTETQNLFPIIQGATDDHLRMKCLRALTGNEFSGYAIGGLSGGESKDDFWRTIALCTENLPRGRPRYAMGVGYAEDLVVLVALGVDMFDCVFPTRTARFGNALVESGNLRISNSEFCEDFSPIDADCGCSTCGRYSLAFLHFLSQNREKGSLAVLLTVHNVAFQMRLMRRIREAIEGGTFPRFCRDFFNSRYSCIPQWIVDALKYVNVELS